ncbi:NfeD family protein [Bacteroidota bacterium]
MEWITVILLIVLGLGFIVAEIIFVPGTTFLGLLGVIFAIAGIVISYTNFGTGTGSIVLIVTLIFGLAMMVYGFKSGAWSKFALKGSIDSKVNEGEKSSLQVGEEGETISTLRPIGKAEFQDTVYEVSTLGNYLEPGIRIRIIKIKQNKIIVEPIT